jgi:alpha-beta hydrolase superfamily lysophospholipase
MGRFFRNDLHDEFGGWLLGYTATGGPDIGVLAAVGAAVGEGDDAAFNAAWVAMGDRFAAEADAALAAGRPDNARRLLFWAAACYATSYHPLYGAPVDPRLVASFRKQIAVFDRALGLLRHPVAQRRIPFEGTTLPGYFLPAEGREEEVRPLVILTDGYDATVTEMYFAEAVAITRRGYHCLLFDGPGQGEMLIEHGMPIRPDWEAVVGPVVDFALTLPGVDRDRIALWGWSLGGYLALRGASGEPRLAACVADPGLREVISPTMLARFGATPADVGAAGPAIDAALGAAAKANPRMHWSLMQRGLWVHGVKTLGDYVAAAMRMTLEGRVGMIRCPTLLTTAEDDPLSQGAGALLAELACPKTLLSFAAAEGAGDHCEIANRSLAQMRMLDWLDATLG